MLKFTGRPWHRKKGWVIACLSQVEGKIEYRNPCLLPGVGFTEALAASFTHSIPPGPRSGRNKKSATPGTLLTAVSLTHTHTNTRMRTEKSGTRSLHT